MRIVLFMLIAGVALPVCGDSGNTASAHPPPVKPVALKKESPPEGRGSLVIRGSVRFKGVPPQRKVIDVGGDKWVAEFYKGKEPLLTEDIVVNEAGKLANVIVYVSKGYEKLTFDPLKDAVVIEEIGARYVPHVTAVMVDQKIVMQNRDETTHNAHWMSRESPEFGVSQTSRNSPPRSFSAPELVVSLGCDVHKWMKAKVGVFDHPFFAVSQADGTFELRGLLPGKYTLAAWHETLGAKTVEIEVKKASMRQ